MHINNRTDNYYMLISVSHTESTYVHEQHKKSILENTITHSIYTNATHASKKSIAVIEKDHYQKSHLLSQQSFDSYSLVVRKKTLINDSHLYKKQILLLAV